LLPFGVFSQGAGFAKRDLLVQSLNVFGIWFAVLELSDSVVGQQHVALWDDPGLLQASSGARHHATVESEDGATAARDLHETRHSATDAGDAGHFRFAGTVEHQRKTIRQLRRAGAA
jgi:hypothetical protein